MAHPVDIHVGLRLRESRTLKGMSQEALGNEVGVTYQQIQKYEKGHNRIGSSRLYEFSKILGINISYFFSDITPNSLEKTKDGDSSDYNIGGNIDYFLEEDDHQVSSSKVLMSHEPSESFEYEEFEIGNKEIFSLVRAFNNISDANIRKNIVSLVKSIANSKNTANNAVQNAKSGDINKSDDINPSDITEK